MLTERQLPKINRELPTWVKLQTPNKIVMKKSKDGPLASNTFFYIQREIEQPYKSRRPERTSNNKRSQLSVPRWCPNSTFRSCYFCAKRGWDSDCFGSDFRWLLVTLVTNFHGVSGCFSAEKGAVFGGWTSAFFSCVYECLKAGFWLILLGNRAAFGGRFWTVWGWFWMLFMAF